MNVKTTICCVLLLLFSTSSAKDVDLRVKGVTSIATTDENFICATLDWWPPNKCDYNDCPWGNAGILNLDLYNDIFLNAVKAFNPLRIRLGGSLEDWLVYQFGKQRECPLFQKKNDGLFGFSKGCLPKKKWDEINHFFNKTGVKLTFGLNALSGKKPSKEDKKNWKGDWDPTNAIDLMEYTISKGYNIDSYELGNELCADGVSARIDSVQYAKDITQLRKTVNLLYQDANTRPKVLGPAGFYGKEWFDSFLQNVGHGVVDGVTHHIYNLGSALLWHRLMGSKVLSVSHEGSPYLRAYVHCSKTESGIAVLLINMSNSTTFEVSLLNDMNLYPEVVFKNTQREEYHLTPKDGNIQSKVVLLNGTPLVLTQSLHIPEMKPKLVDPSSPVKVKHDSIVFVHSKSFNAPACM
ncbi:hypothetical protein JHK86_003831 [Glycine max]|nr:hypothetical protein JHK86_003831 [Glycine max]